MRWLHFILSHSIFIAFCALALCYQTYTLLHLPGNIYMYGFIFFSTLCSYNFYWLISKFAFRKKKGLYNFAVDNVSYLVIFFVAGTFAAAMLLELPGLMPYILIAVLLTLMYSLPLWPFSFAIQLRKAGFMKTTLLAFTWAYVTTILPAVLPASTSHWQLLTLLCARFFFMLLLCTIFDMRDAKIDKMNALRSLATDVSRPVLEKVMILVFIGYIIAGLMVRYHFGDNSQLVAFMLTGLLVWWVYRASLKDRGYVFYYFLVDGLMLMSAMGTWLAAR